MTLFFSSLKVFFLSCSDADRYHCCLLRNHKISSSFVLPFVERSDAIASFLLSIYNGSLAAISLASFQNFVTSIAHPDLLDPFVVNLVVSVTVEFTGTHPPIFVLELTFDASGLAFR